MTPFFFHDRMTDYDFGPRHPLKPERLRRTLHLFQQVASDVPILDPGLAHESDVERVHDHDFVNAVHTLSSGDHLPGGIKAQYGFGSGDNPPFPDMYEASLAYCGGAVRAAEAVRDGAPLAFSIAGGLHHAMRGRAAGFCIFNDPAIAVSVLRERFERVMYVDIDLHHGDGVEAIFAADPDVLTYSIHQDGRTLFPGTGFVRDVGSAGTAANVPVPPETTGDVWLGALRETLPGCVEAFRPQAIVLQMGCDPHATDPLGHLMLSAQEWVEGVQVVRDQALPIVAFGGGGYDISNVPRMWVAAILTLMRRDIPEWPEGIPTDWGMSAFFDATLPEPREVGAATVEATLQEFERTVLPRLSG